jgi:hypothetical protein
MWIQHLCDELNPRWEWLWKYSGKNIASADTFKYEFRLIFASFIFVLYLQAVELWLADKAVLPIESSSGGSIHRNYDLLLRHRLHIVGEVQLAATLCLLALPGVRAEQLKRVLSHPQVKLLIPLSLSPFSARRRGIFSILKLVILAYLFVIQSA